MDLLNIANTSFKIKAFDSAQMDLSSKIIASMMTVTKSEKIKVGSEAVLKIEFNLQGIGTTLITDNNGQGSGTMEGTSEKVLDNGKKICLADENATALTVSSSKCSKVTINLQGTAGSGQTPIPSDPITIWISDAGQDKVQGI